MTAANDSELDLVVFPPASGSRAKQVVVFLHGYGGDGHGLEPMVARWREFLPDAELVAPHGPARCGFQSTGREWYPLTRLVGPMRERANAAAPAVDRLIDSLIASRGIAPGKIALTGFSQGAVMSLLIGVRRRPALGAIVSFAGMLVSTDDLPRLADAPPFMLVQGDADRMVTLASMRVAESAMVAGGARVETVVRDGVDHRIDAPGLDASGAFLRAALTGDD